MINLRTFASSSLCRILAAASHNRSCTRGHANFLAPSSMSMMMPIMHGSISSTRKGVSINNHQKLHSEPHPKTPEEEPTKGKHVSLANQSSRRTTFPKWVRWTLRSILCLFLPFWKGKWEGLLTLEGKVDKATETAENVAEVVEKVASVAEQISEKMADKLPDDSTLKDTALLVKYVSKEAIKDAQLAKELIHKVDDFKQEMAETVFDPIIDSKKLRDKEDHVK